MWGCIGVQGYRGSLLSARGLLMYAKCRFYSILMRELQYVPYSFTSFFDLQTAMCPFDCVAYGVFLCQTGQCTTGVQVYRPIYIQYVTSIVARAACICRMSCVSRYLNYLNIPLGRRIESHFIYTRYIPMNWWGQRLAPLHGRIRPSYSVYCELRTECCVGPSCVSHLL